MFTFSILIILVMFEAYNYHLSLLIKDRLLDLTKIKELQVESNMILQGLDLSVLTLEDNRIKFINEEAKSLIGNSLKVIEDQQRKLQGHALIQKLHRHSVELSRPVDYSAGQLQLQDELLNSKIFQLHIKNKEKVKTEDREEYSLNQLCQVDPTQVRHLIFMAKWKEDA